MELINDLYVRKQIELYLARIHDLTPELSQSKLSIENIDAFCQVLISDNRSKVNDDVRVQLSKELSIGYFGVLAIGLMSFSVQFENLRLINQNWIDPHLTPDPNRVLGAMLGNIANYALGIIGLVELGLEAPARTCLRSMLELSWITLAIVGDYEKMIAYTQNREADTKEIYFKHFSSKKLWDAISKIEKRIELPKDVSEILANLRRELYSMYSSNVHHSYSSLITGSMSFSFEEEDRITPNLFGKADRASRPTLHHMNDALFVFFGILVKILRSKHRLSPPYPENLQEIISLIQCYSILVTEGKKPQAASV